MKIKFIRWLRQLETNSLTLDVSIEMVSREVKLAVQVAVIVGTVTVELILSWLLLLSWEVPFTISSWLLGFSIAYFIYRENRFINSILVAAIFPILFVIGFNMLAGSFFDVLHLPILIAGIVVIFSRSPFRMLYIIFGIVIFVSWAWFVWLTGLAYQYFTLELMIAEMFVMGVGVILSYGLARYKGYLSYQSAKATIEETEEAVKQRLSKVKE